MKETKKDQIIQNVLDKFNFVKVRETMKLLEWTWATSEGKMCVPNVTELIDTARELLGYLKEKGIKSASTGGFFAGRNRNWEKVTLSFVLEDWEECK